MHTEFWWENLKQRDHYEDLDIDRRVILKWSLRAKDRMVWTSYMWLRTQTSGRLM
jgi:hypothetical protein